MTRKLLAPGQSVMVAVSGGLDSMVLLHALHELAKEHRWRLTVAHLNHHLRARSSDADERLVRKRAAELNLPCASEEADVRRFARDKNLSIEMAARQLRHEFFARAARERGIEKVALAHHADDQVELFFLRLLRGTSGEGLRGMKWIGSSPSDRKTQLIRPLLDLSKEDLRHFAGKEKIPFREDASNAALDILRNRVRRELLPLLRKHYQPAVAKTTLRLMDLLEADSDFISQSANLWLEKRTPPFHLLPMALQRRIIQRQLFQRGGKLDFELIEQLRTAPGAPVTLDPDCRVLRGEDGLLQWQNISAAGFSSGPREAKLQGQRGSIEFDGLTVHWKTRLAGKFRASIKPVPRCEFFDADKVGPAIIVRHWLPGDRFQPIGMGVSVKLQDLFTNQKIPQPKRQQLAIAATETGDIFWVEGLRMSERFKLTRQTVRTLKWIWQRD